MMNPIESKRQATAQKILDALPGTMGEIAKQAGMNRKTFDRHQAYLREHGLMHIARWRRLRVAGPPAAVFAAGPGVDAVRPKATSPSELARHARLEKAQVSAAEVESMVRRAMRQVPNSIFNLAQQGATNDR